MTPFDFFNNKVYEYQSNFFITNHYSPRGGRQFLTEINAIKVDGIRQDLERFYLDKDLNDNEYFYLLASLLESVTKFSNTTGTYEAFLKVWDCRALKTFVLCELEFNKTVNDVKSNIVYQKDANLLIREIYGDILMNLYLVMRLKKANQIQIFS